MRKGIHPDSYRLCVFKDLSTDYAILTKSCAESKETVVSYKGSIAIVIIIIIDIIIICNRERKSEGKGERKREREREIQTNGAGEIYIVFNNKR